MQNDKQSKPFYTSPIFLGVSLVLLYVFYGLSQANAMEEKTTSENKVGTEKVEQVESETSETKNVQSNGLFDDGGVSNGSFEKSLDDIRSDNKIRTEANTNEDYGVEKTYFQDKNFFEEIKEEYFQNEEKAPKNPQNPPSSGDTKLRPELVPVCACESSYEGAWWGEPKQFDPDGSIRMSRLGTNDVGICQINSYYHGASAKSLGYDLYTKEGNIKFANWLFDLKGYQPWYPSKGCWKNAPVA